MRFFWVKTARRTTTVSQNKHASLRKLVLDVSLDKRSIAISSLAIISLTILNVSEYENFGFLQLIMISLSYSITIYVFHYICFPILILSKRFKELSIFTIFLFLTTMAYVFVELVLMTFQNSDIGAFSFLRNIAFVFLIFLVVQVISAVNYKRFIAEFNALALELNLLPRVFDKTAVGKTARLISLGLTAQEANILVELPPEKRSKILRIESYRNYLTIHTKKGEHILRATLKEFVQRLGPGVGTVVHRSHWIRNSEIVGFNYVDGNPRLSTADGQIIPVSRKKVKIVKRIADENSLL